MEVLIVEDEPVIAKAVASALESRGHTLRIVDARELVSSQPLPDALVVEQYLRGRSGFDVLAELGAAGPLPRTVVVTATPTLEDCRKAMRLGVHEYLPKPFRLEELVRAIEGPGPQRRPERFRAGYLTGRNLIARCARDLGAFVLRVGVGPSCRARIITAVGELLENAIRHAYPGREGRVAVEALVDGRELVVTVADEGCGFSTATAAARRLTSPRHDGLARTAALAEGLWIDSEPGRGTRVTVRFGAYRVDYDNEDLVDLSELDYLAPSTSREILRTLESDGSAGYFQLSPALAVVIGRFLSGAGPEKVVPQVLWS